MPDGCINTPQPMLQRIKWTSQTLSRLFLFCKRMELYCVLYWGVSYKRKDGGTLGDTCFTVRRGKQPKLMDCLIIWNAPEIMAWLATQAANMAMMKNVCKAKGSVACLDSLQAIIICIRWSILWFDPANSQKGAHKNPENAKGILCHAGSCRLHKANKRNAYPVEAITKRYGCKECVGNLLDVFGHPCCLAQIPADVDFFGSLSWPINWLIQVVIEKSTTQYMARAMAPLTERMKSFACLSGQISSVLGRWEDAWNLRNISGHAVWFYSQ